MIVTAVALVAAMTAWTDPASATNPTELQPLLQRSISVDGVEREYWVYVPEDYAEFRLYDPKDKPLVLILHPDGMDGETYAQQTAWTRLAEERTFIAVFPSARAGERQPDDAQFIEDVTDTARSKWKSNEVFTYLVGEGSGAAVANTVAATRATKYVAVASLGGAAPRTLWRGPGPASTAPTWRPGRSSSDGDPALTNWRRSSTGSGRTACHAT